MDEWVSGGTFEDAAQPIVRQRRLGSGDDGRERKGQRMEIIYGRAMCSRVAGGFISWGMQALLGGW